MKRIVVVFGTILGIIMCLQLIYLVHLMYSDPNLKSNDLAGYALQIVTFSITFFGIRNYRNNYQDGIITFGKAFKVGAFIALAGATMYVIFWLFYYYLAVPDFVDVYISHALKRAVTNGATVTELAEKATEMKNFKEMYKNPLFVVLITYFEVLPVGLVVALVSALILKKKPIIAANNLSHE